MSAYLNDDAQPCGPDCARFVFAGVNLPQAQDSDIVIPYRYRLVDECCLTLTTYVNGLNFSYYDLRSVSRFTPKIMAITGAALAGNFRAGLSEENHHDFYTRPIHLQPKPVSDDEIVRAIENTKEFPVSRISQDHHMYVTRRELITAYQTFSKVKGWESETRKAAAMWLIENAAMLDIANRVSITTHLMYIAVAPAFAVKHLMWIAATSHDPESYMAKLKAESAAAKQLQTLFRDDLACIYELQVLRNRVYDEVDWDKEIRNRHDYISSSRSRASAPA